MSLFRALLYWIWLTIPLTASVSESSVGEQIQSSLDLLQRVYASRSLRFIHLNTVRASTQTLNILPHADFLKQSRRRRLPLKGTRAVVALRRQDVSLWERRAAASPDAVRRSPLTAHPKCLTKSKSRSLRSLLSLVVPQTSWTSTIAFRPRLDALIYRDSFSTHFHTQTKHTVHHLHTHIHLFICSLLQ